MEVLDPDVFSALAAVIAGRRITLDQTNQLRHARARLGRLILAAGGILPEVA